MRVFQPLTLSRSIAPDLTHSGQVTRTRIAYKSPYRYSFHAVMRDDVTGKEYSAGLWQTATGEIATELYGHGGRLIPEKHLQHLRAGLIDFYCSQYSRKPVIVLGLGTRYHPDPHNHPNKGFTLGDKPAHIVPAAPFVPSHAACEADAKNIAATMAKTAARRALLRATGVERDAAGQITAGTLETSHGASVPLLHAVKAFPLIKLCRERGQGWKRNGHTVRVGHFQIDEIDAAGNFKAGCHDIGWNEVERVAVALGVFDAAPADISESTHA